MKEPKLTVELIPKTCYYSNVRTLLSTKEWNRIRKEEYIKANLKCQICNDIGTNQGYKHNLECHEKWGYSKSKVQFLIELVVLCPLCHMCKHIGRANMMGNQAKAFAHMEKVNNWTHKQVVTHVGNAFETFRERSNHEWTINLKILVEKHDVDKLVISESQKKPRITTPPKRGRRRKKKK